MKAERAFNQNKLLEKEQNILDFGCNNGFFLFELSKLMKQESNLYGIDSKEEYLNIAKEVKSEFNLNNIFFHQSNNLDFGKDIKNRHLYSFKCVAPYKPISNNKR